MVDSEEVAWLCSKCGDRCVSTTPHDCWVREKERAQERLQAPAVSDIAVLWKEALRDDGQPIAGRPRFVSEVD